MKRTNCVCAVGKEQSILGLKFKSSLLRGEDDDDVENFADFLRVVSEKQTKGTTSIAATSTFYGYIATAGASLWELGITDGPASRGKKRRERI